MASSSLLPCRIVLLDILNKNTGMQTRGWLDGIVPFESVQFFSWLYCFSGIPIYAMILLSQTSLLLSIVVLAPSDPKE